MYCKLTRAFNDLSAQLTSITVMMTRGGHMFYSPAQLLDKSRPHIMCPVFCAHGPSRAALHLRCFLCERSEQADNNLNNEFC